MHLLVNIKCVPSAVAHILDTVNEADIAFLTPSSVGSVCFHLNITMVMMSTIRDKPFICASLRFHSI